MASELRVSDLEKYGQVELIITLEENAHIDYVNKWTYIANTFHESRETGRKDIVQNAINKCKLPANRQRTILRRRESGVAGATNNNAKDKQLRFRMLNSLTQSNEITLIPIDSDDGTECWSMTELMDFLHAFREEFDDILESHGGLLGYIRIKPRREEG